MSFDEIFDLTAGVYFNFYNNTRILLDRRFGSILLWANSSIDWLFSSNGRRNLIPGIFHLDLLDRRFGTKKIWGSSTGCFRVVDDEI